MELYYECKNSRKKDKKFSKRVKKLNGIDKFCSHHEESFYNKGNRAIIVFNDLATREKVYRRYRIGNWTKARMFFSNDF